MSRLEAFLDTLKSSLCLLLASLMVSVPAYAVTNQGMIPTSVVVAEMDRAQAQQRIQDFVKRADVQKALIDRGVSPSEVSSRLASLSETELHQLAGQVEQARAGGDILIVILIVVLIIFLIKKM
jgi:hypothetical protein